MTKKLLDHFRLMQRQAGRYIEPTPDYSYFASDSGCWTEGETPTREERQAAFTADMIYMLDGPEQREAQAHAEFDYLAESERTASGHFHGDLVSLETIRRAFGNFIEAAAEIDRVKKLLFYGQDKAKGRLADTNIGVDNAFVALGAVTRSASGDREKISFGSPAMHRAEYLIHGAIGVASESGEMIEALFKAIFRGDMDLTNLAEEVGDAQWYEAMLARALGTDFDTIQRTNIAKLRARFPDKFTTERANERNLDAERAILEGGTEPAWNSPEGQDARSRDLMSDRVQTQFEGLSNEVTGGQNFDSDEHLRDGLGLPLPGTVSVRRPVSGEGIGAEHVGTQGDPASPLGPRGYGE